MLSDGEEGPVSNVVLPPDLPLDAIAEEVQRSWRAKEVHVEGLIQKVGSAAACMLPLVIFGGSHGHAW